MAARKAANSRRNVAFDAYDLATRRATLSGTLEVSALSRIADLLAEDVGDATINWRVEGTTDAIGRPALAVALEGRVRLDCQRCLQAFDWTVRQRTVVLLARDERELAKLDDDDEHEVILAATPLEAAALVEDELVLTLPLAPHCERPVCAVRATEAMDVTTDGAASPFDALIALKRAPEKKAR